MELVSVVIPTFNRFKYLLKTIESVKKQTYSNIEIIDIVYGLTMSIDKNIDVSKIIGCVSSIFNVQQGNLNKTGIDMRFKKVSDYSKTDSIDAFILDLLKKEIHEDEIIEGIEQNFRLSNKNAREKLAEVVSAAEVVHSLYKKKQISIKKSPGFLTLFKFEFISGSDCIFSKSVTEFGDLFNSSNL
jgi:cellulose synthase/poly-beta-1,6-N-acetylglucosamine synthase-like glycosyltransferase